MVGKAISRHLLIILLSFGLVGCLTTSPEQLRASGEDFPIRYSCEFTPGVLYLQLNIDNTGSLIFDYQGSGSFKASLKTAKLKNIRSYELRPQLIQLALPLRIVGLGGGGVLQINRATGQASQLNTIGPQNNGKCYRGYKVYE